MPSTVNLDDLRTVLFSCSNSKVSKCGVFCFFVSFGFFCFVLGVSPPPPNLSVSMPTVLSEMDHRLWLVGSES